MNGKSFFIKVIKNRERKAPDAMLDMIIALFPALIAGFIYFGYRAVLLSVSGVVGAVLAEFLFEKLFRHTCTYRNLSAVVTGMIIAMCMPPLISPVVCALISAAAVVLTRDCFGGMGFEIVEPAAFGAVLPAISFPLMSNLWSEAFTGSQTAVTPLTAENTEFTLKQLLFGAHSGAVGEVGILFLLAGAVYLLVRGVITPVVPVCMILSSLAFSFVFGTDPIITLFGGGLFLCSFFVATNPAVTPERVSGQVVFGVLCGLIYVVLQWRCPSTQSVYFAVLISNLLTPLVSLVPEFKFKEAGENE